MIEHTRGHEVPGHKIQVALINMEGERDPSLHEPIGVESIASRLTHEIPGITPVLIDTQPELARHGKIDTDQLAQQARKAGSDPSQPFVLGLGVPIYSWEYTRSLLLKLELDPPEAPMTVVLGNAIPTYTDTRLIHEDFPYVSVVKGEGEEIFADIVGQVADGQPIDPIYEFAFPDLNNYVAPDRGLTQGVIDLGGSVKVEASRGCDYGKCTFCSRCVRTGEDYRVIPEDRVVEQMQQLLDEYDISRFELTDEEAFGDIEATARLISVVKSSGLPSIPFTASLRVEVFNELHKKGLLSQLQEIGLNKVFLGAEGGSDSYLRSIGKGQTVAEIEESLKIAQEAGMNLELGFITFAWKMDIDMLRENVEFLSRDNHADYVSALFNTLAVRAGTNDEKQLLEYVRRGDITGYDPVREFSVNLSLYQHVPYMDPEVARAYEDVSDYAKKDAQLYYAVKSTVRADALDPAIQQKVRGFYLEMKGLHLRKLRETVGLEQYDDLTEDRRLLVQRMREYVHTQPNDAQLAILNREIEVFCKEERERAVSQGDQTGSMLVCVDDNNRMLLVRPRNSEEWTFPGGNIDDGEDPQSAMLREAREELGVSSVEILDELPTIIKKDHDDATTGRRPRLTLHHHLARIDKSDVDIHAADHEIADTIWLPLEMIRPPQGERARIRTKPNVGMIVQYLQEGVMDEPESSPESAVTVRRRRTINVMSQQS